MGWELQDVLAASKVPHESNAVEISCANERAVALEAHCVDRASVTLLHKQLFLLLHIVQAPGLVV